MLRSSIPGIYGVLERQSHIYLRDLDCQLCWRKVRTVRERLYGWAASSIALLIQAEGKWRPSASAGMIIFAFNVLYLYDKLI